MISVVQSSEQALCYQVMEVLARCSVCERASIDECYLDVTEEARRRLAACAGHPPLPPDADRIHIPGQAGCSPVHLLGA